MKKIHLLLLILCLSLPLTSQDIQEKSQVINVEIPVRVFLGKTFIDNLTIADFEIFEEGILQDIEVVYLVKKRSIERSQEKKKFSPRTARNYFLFFEVTEYSSRLGDAVKYFIHNVILPDDSLTIVTPLKTYRQTTEAFKHNTKEELTKQLTDILKKDITMGNSQYRSTLIELTGLASTLASDTGRGAGEDLRIMDTSSSNQYSHYPFDRKLQKYASILERLESLRKVDQEKLLGFSNYLKELEGQKYVFLLYQREFIPQIEPRIMNKYMDLYQDSPHVLQTLTSLFSFYHRDVSFNVDLVKQSYADSSISIHFLFLTPPSEHMPGLVFNEHSEDIFSAFREMALATGGSVESSANPEYLIHQAVKASENYYLLYYSPLNYKEDGKFKRVEVRVKRKKYKVVHRYGYFAN